MYMLYYYKSFISNTCKNISYFKTLLIFKTKLKQIFRFNLFNVFFFELVWYETSFVRPTCTFYLQLYNNFLQFSPKKLFFSF